MSATLFTEQPRLTASQLAQAQDVHVSTAVRWFERGAKGVKLESFLIGAGKRVTTGPAFERWLAAINGEQPSTPSATPRQREHAVQSAEAQLAELGV